MAVHAKVNLFLSNICAAIQTLIEVWLYGFVAHKIQCHIKINWCLYNDVAGMKTVACSRHRSKYLLAFA